MQHEPAALCYFKPALQFTRVLKNCSLHKGRTPSPCWKLWADRSESCLNPYLRWPGISVSRKLIQITLGCSRCHKTALFPLMVSLWSQFREPMCWKLPQPALSHWWVLGWELHAAWAGLDRIPPSAGWRRAAVPQLLWVSPADSHGHLSSSGKALPFTGPLLGQPISSSRTAASPAAKLLQGWQQRWTLSSSGYPEVSALPSEQAASPFTWAAPSCALRCPQLCCTTPGEAEVGELPSWRCQESPFLGMGSGLGALWRCLKRYGLSFQQELEGAVPQQSAPCRKKWEWFWLI